MRLSFIIPVFKTEQHLVKCLRSLAQQSLKEWEAIIVLDGPSSEAREIVKREMKGKAHKVIEIEHGGACKARNAGFAESTGDVVCFFDSDCVIEKEAARAWLEVFDSEKDTAFVYAGYKWFDETVPSYGSEEFDPWLLRVNNYISTCFPVRREFVQKWNEDLKSLQDWDFWLRVVEAGGKGRYLQGYSWSTAVPSSDSISGIGCSDENWLERLDAVKKLHGIPIKETCVSALSDRQDGIRLAKLLDADYRDFPLEKPNHYKTIVQVGFSFQRNMVQHHSNVFGDKKKYRNILFWTSNDVTEAYNIVGRKALVVYSDLLNEIAEQYVEDNESKKLMEVCGFKTEILPLPIVNTKTEIDPLPEAPRFLVDITGEYSLVMNAVEKSMPDVKLDGARGAQKISDYTGLIYYHTEPVMSNSIKRMLLAGRHVISNVQQPFAGYLDDKVKSDDFIPKIVNRIRGMANKGQNSPAKSFYDKLLGPSRLVEVLK